MYSASQESTLGCLSFLYASPGSTSFSLGKLARAHEMLKAWPFLALSAS